jgi:hypothetical protein
MWPSSLFGLAMAAPFKKSAKINILFFILIKHADFSSSNLVMEN